MGKTLLKALESDKLDLMQTLRMKNKGLWIIQAICAILFMFAGITKLAADPQQLVVGTSLRPEFMQFVAVCEILGAIGLIVPAVTGILPWLTRVAALALLVIMIGAVVVTLMSSTLAHATAVIPFVVGLLLTTILIGRGRIPPGSGAPAHH